MVFSGDAFTIFLAGATLVLLSIYTIEKCRKSNLFLVENYQDFLFGAKTAKYSLAGSIGAVFSITYYGAAVVYGQVFGAWFILLVTASFLSSSLALLWIIQRIHMIVPESRVKEGRTNLLLEYFRFSLPERNYRHIVQIFVAIYFSLLVEEIAISRMTLSVIFPDNPLVPPALLTVLFFVLFWYLRLGGFRAVLVSDYEQLKILFPFVVALIFIIFKATANLHDGIKISNIITAIRTGTADPAPLPFLFGLVFFVCWLVGALDFYSRLNFRGHTSTTPSGHKRFVLLAFASMFLMFLVAALLGATLPESFKALNSPSEFTREALAYFFATGSRATDAILLAGIFCMMFTTIDTILVTLSQASSKLSKDYFQTVALSRTLALAVLFSTVVPFDYVSAAGIFSGSLMIVPCCLIVATVGEVQKVIRPMLWPSVTVSFILFLAFSPWLILKFERQFLIPAIVLATVFVLWGGKSLFRLQQKWRVRE